MSDKVHLYPEAWLNRMSQQVNISVDDLIAALNKSPTTSIRINPLKPAYNPSGTNIPWSVNGYQLSQRPSFTLDPLFHGGTYYVQESSSMFLEHVIRTLDFDGPIRALDMCAAPGGKTTLLASHLGEEDILLANEVINSRVKILEENVVKWGSGNVLISNLDPDKMRPLKGFFNLILVDAPCSGEGLFRKDSKATEHWSEDQVAMCSSRQQRILEASIKLLEPGGYLLYSTCTYAPQENEDNANWMVKEFDLRPISVSLNEGWNIIQKESRGVSSYHFYPHLVEGEGFFFACFQKSGTQEEKEGKSKKKEEKIDIKLREAVESWIDTQNLYLWLDKYQQVWAIPLAVKKKHQQIKKSIPLYREGLRLGKLIGGELIPDHQLAMTNGIKKSVPRIDLDREVALDYLRRNTIPFKPEYQLGWTLITHRQVPLGWAKVLPNRVNNYYPKPYMIRNL